MTSSIDLYVGQRLRHRRWLRGMTQVELATSVGMRFQQIQKYECGANRISASRLWDLARTLNVHVSYFYAGLGQTTQDHGLCEDALQQKETMDLVRAYYAMNEKHRRSLFDLMRAASKQESSYSVSDNAA